MAGFATPRTLARAGFANPAESIFLYIYIYIYIYMIIKSYLCHKNIYPSMYKLILPRPFPGRATEPREAGDGAPEYFIMNLNRDDQNFSRLWRRETTGRVLGIQVCTSWETCFCGIYTILFSYIYI